MMMSFAGSTFMKYSPSLAPRWSLRSSRFSFCCVLSVCGIFTPCQKTWRMFVFGSSISIISSSSAMYRCKRLPLSFMPAEITKVSSVWFGGRAASIWCRWFIFKPGKASTCHSIGSCRVSFSFEVPISAAVVSGRWRRDHVSLFVLGCVNASLISCGGGGLGILVWGCVGDWC